jgi:hypothetical protein
MGGENRKTPRFHFDRGYPARIMAIDGTWQRPCQIANVSRLGAKLIIDGSVDRLNLDEFFLLLSTNGTAHRRCRMMWLRGDQLGIRYVETNARQEPQFVSARPNDDSDADMPPIEVWSL